jgi:hypothetical protein
MGFLVITFSNMLSFAPIANLAFSAMGLGGRIHVGDIDVGELGGGNDASGRLVYATDRNQDLIFWMDAWLSC